MAPHYSAPGTPTKIISEKKEIEAATGVAAGITMGHRGSLPPLSLQIISTELIFFRSGLEKNQKIGSNRGPVGTFRVPGYSG
jgi:hypothetical protein